MGFLKKFKQKQKNKEKETNERAEEFKEKIRQLGREYGMAIVPIMTKYGLEIEIQVITEERKEQLEKEIEKGNSEELTKKL